MMIMVGVSSPPSLTSSSSSSSTSAWLRWCCWRRCIVAAILLLLGLGCRPQGFAYGQLVINVQNLGGEVVQETIAADTSADLITLEFQRSDGTLITQIIDFRKEVQVIKALVLGEEERGQSQYQVMCFLTKLQTGDFISSDAMAKLRQKNPSTIRQPEEDRGWDNYTMSARVILDRAAPLSPHIKPLCAEAKDSTYVRDIDLKAFAELPGASLASLAASVQPFPPSAPARCSDVYGLWAPCLCSLEMCIGWYPCGLKYCKGKSTADGGGAAAPSNASFRCGIKTCRKCTHFLYYVPEKQRCLWDD